MVTEKELEVKSTDIITLAKLPIVDQDSYDKAAETAKSIKGLIKEVDEAFDATIRANHTAWKTSIEAKKRYAEPLEQADALVRKSMTVYKTEQDRLQREAAVKALEEQKRLEEAAAAERVRQAEQLKGLGMDDLAEEVAQSPIDVPVMSTKTPVLDQQGIRFRDNWKFRVVDFAKLPDEYKLPNETMLGGLARSTKGAVAVPGVEFYSEKSAII